MAAVADSHVLLNKIAKLSTAGLTDKAQLHQAVQVYLHLSEYKEWWNISIEPCLSLNKAIICGHPSATAPRHVVLPIESSEQFSVIDIGGRIEELTKQFDCDSVILALMEPDSTIAYHTMSLGFVPPDPPEKIEEKQKQKRRQFQRKQNQFTMLRTENCGRSGTGS